MNPNMAAFLQYDYAGVNDLAKFGLGLSSASFAFLVAFADKVLEIAKAPKRIRINLDLSFYALICAAALCIIALVCGQLALSALRLSSLSTDDAQRLSLAATCLWVARISLGGAGLCHVFGLLAALNGSITWTHTRKED